MKIVPKKVKMARQKPSARVTNFNEVALGYSEEEAQQEARRCLQCKKAPCIKGCPVEIDIPSFIAKIIQKDYRGAIRKIKESNLLPAMCGRVCPQEGLCEKACTLGKKYEPVAIGRLERFAADWEIQKGNPESSPRVPPTGKRLAVIGSGPGSLSCAGDLIRLGHSVTIFEALHKPGGVLVYGIPEFRLPKAIVEREVEYIRSLGVEVKSGYVIGKIYTLDELFSRGYDAIFIGIGAGLPKFMNIPGENLNGVYSANEFLTRTNLMKAYLFPEYDTPVKIGRRVAVVGGGNVAMDASRVALRLGARKVFDIYRRSPQEMPARAEEVQNARDEGVEVRFLTNPVRILGNKDNWVTGIECIKMELGEPDESGRRRPVPVKGSEFTIEVDTIVMAIGAGANPLLPSATPDLKLNKWGYIVIDENSGKTSKEGVWAGGDIVSGAATVISAMASGRSSARAIHQYLMASHKNK
ncbi:MAG: NADPH-dependent glutamate synthase [Elusimicrobiota bacterium]|nr:NADPH-dependent glutamate synthase [Elusimicrobiota bacterium]